MFIKVNFCYTIMATFLQMKFSNDVLLSDFLANAILIKVFR